MMLNLKQEAIEQEKIWLTKKILIGPGVLAVILLGELIYILTSGTGVMTSSGATVDAKAVGMSLYGPYVIGVELSGILLMSGIVGAYHLGRQKKKIFHRFIEMTED
jgi:NADH-quinone oxidoreductase subunit J